MRISWRIFFIFTWTKFHYTFSFKKKKSIRMSLWNICTKRGFWWIPFINIGRNCPEFTFVATIWGFLVYSRSCFLNRCLMFCEEIYSFIWICLKEKFLINVWLLEEPCFSNLKLKRLSSLSLFEDEKERESGGRQWSTTEDVWKRHHSIFHVFLRTHNKWKSFLNFFRHVNLVKAEDETYSTDGKWCVEERNEWELQGGHRGKKDL